MNPFIILNIKKLYNLQKSQSASYFYKDFQEDLDKN